MADNLVIYTIIHQPRRPRLPAYPVPDDATVEELESYLFDDSLNKFYLQKVARYCYHPAIELFQSLVEKGMRMSLGLSISFLDQAMAWDKPLVEKLKRLVGHPNVELVCVEPYHSFLFYIDMQKFQERMVWAQQYLAEMFGKRPEVAETTEMFMSREIYHSLDKLGFKATLAEGRQQMLDWRSPTYLYRHRGKDLGLLIRHKDLSDDVGYRFSQTSWPGYPLTAQSYVDWIKGASGDFVFVGWDFETFGEHHSVNTGIFEFMKWVAGELNWRGVETLTISQAAERFRYNSHEIEIPVIPTTWAGLHGDPRFFLGNSAQFNIFTLMSHAYSVARLTGDPRFIDIALMLCQSDNLHLLQWLTDGDSSEAEVSSYFTPGYWFNLGNARIPLEIGRVFENFITAANRRLQAAKPNENAKLAEPTKTEVGRTNEHSRREVTISVGDQRTLVSAGSRPPHEIRLAADETGRLHGRVEASPGTHEYNVLLGGKGNGNAACAEASADGCRMTNCTLQVTVK